MSYLEDDEDFEVLKKIFILYEEGYYQPREIQLLSANNSKVSDNEEEIIEIKQYTEIKRFISAYKKIKYDDIAFSAISNNSFFQNDGYINIYLLNAIRFVNQSAKNILIEKNSIRHELQDLYENKDYTNIIYNTTNILDLLVTEISDFDLTDLPLFRLLNISIYKMADILIGLHFAAKDKASFYKIKKQIDYMYCFIKAFEVYTRSCILNIECINSEIDKLHKMKLSKKMLNIERDSIIQSLYKNKPQI